MIWIRIMCGMLTLALVRMAFSQGINHALGKPAIGSTYMKENEQSPDKVVDGCYQRGMITSTCCFASERELSPWISLDLLANIMISQITVYGFLCPERLQYINCHQSYPLWIMLSNDSLDLTTNDESYFTKYTLDVGLYEEGLLNITFTDPVNSRYVGVKKFNEDAVQSMIVCEIEIFGACADSTLSEDCMHTCHCMVGTCDGPDRRCLSDCVEGWFGDRCDKPCQTGYYGSNCAAICSTCASNACDPIDGRCLEGCTSGWSGDMCSESCSALMWGPGCRRKCGNCLIECDSYTGHCQQCKLGWAGNSCRRKCRPGKYGHKCTQTCNQHCLVSCHYATGICEDGCEQGWKGETCEYKCQDDDDDISSCVTTCPPCGNGTCDTSTGICREPCDAGFIGDYCDEPCPDLSYGMGCAKRCGRCKDFVQCNNIDGDCPNGCQDGYTGSQCEELEQSRDEPTSFSADNVLIIVIIVVAGCLFVILLIFAVMSTRKGRKEAKAKARADHGVSKASTRVNPSGKMTRHLVLSKF